MQRISTLGSDVAREWSSPKIFNLADQNDFSSLQELFASNEVVCIKDSIESIAQNLFELRKTKDIYNKSVREEYVDGILEQGDYFGRWAYYPWNGYLVHYPNEQDFYDLRTFRYRNLITTNEQNDIASAKVVVAGMSVGGVIAESLVKMGVKDILLSDLAMPNISNIGRASFTVVDMDVLKVHTIAKKISELDPYVRITLHLDGVNLDSCRNIVEYQPDVIVDEVDCMQASARLRLLAKERSIAYLNASDVHDNAVLEVSRHDIGTSPLYASALEDSVAYDILAGRLNNEALMNVFAQSVGYANLSPRLMKSSAEIGRETAGIPQLGSTASVVAGFVTVACREILTHNLKPVTGMYTLKMAAQLGTGWFEE